METKTSSHDSTSSFNNNDSSVAKRHFQLPVAHVNSDSSALCNDSRLTLKI